MALKKTIPEADFTPEDLNLRLFRRNHTPVTFTWTDTVWTGFTNPVLLWAEKPASGIIKSGVIQVPAVIDSGTPGRIIATFNEEIWKLIPNKATLGYYQLQISDASGNLHILVNGMTTIEESLWL
jgi:hypothetical protein